MSRQIADLEATVAAKDVRIAELEAEIDNLESVIPVTRPDRKILKLVDDIHDIVLQIAELR